MIRMFLTLARTRFGVSVFDTTFGGHRKNRIAVARQSRFWRGMTVEAVQENCVEQDHGKTPGNTPTLRPPEIAGQQDYRCDGVSLNSVGRSSNEGVLRLQPLVLTMPEGSGRIRGFRRRKTAEDPRDCSTSRQSLDRLLECHAAVGQSLQPHGSVRKQMTEHTQRNNSRRLGDSLS